MERAVNPDTPGFNKLFQAIAVGKTVWLNIKIRTAIAAAAISSVFQSRRETKKPTTNGNQIIGSVLVKKPAAIAKIAAT